MDEFHKTRMGQRFYESTMPSLVRAVEGLSDQLDAKLKGERDPLVAQLLEATDDLVEAVDVLMQTEIVPGTKETRDAFQNVQGFAVAARRAANAIR